MRPHLEEIRGEGAELVVIGSGTPDMARDFQQQFARDIPVYVDQKRASFRAVGMKRGVCASIGPAAALKAFRALARGAWPGRVQGDPWQQGGALVVEPPGRIVWEYQSKDSGDHAPPAKLLAALRGRRRG